MVANEAERFESKVEKTTAAPGKRDEPAVFEHEAPPFFAEGTWVPAWLQTIIAHMYIFTAVHYNLWMVPVFALLYVLYQSGYGLVGVAVLALYVPSFLDGAQKKPNGREWSAFRMCSMWNFTAHYLGLKIIREQELDASRKYIFGCHPHGIIVLSRLTSYGGNWERVFPNIITRVLCASTMFYVPFARDMCLWLGCVDASRSTAEKVLNEGHSVYVYPGGVPEIFLTNPNSKENEIVLSQRQGFIRLAIRHGADLVPTFVFGEKWLHNRWNPPQSVISFFQRTLKIPMIIFWGRFLWMPKRPPQGKKFGIVYGTPIPTTKSAEPDDDQVRAIHAQYTAEVERLFLQYKAQFGYDGDETLVVR